MKGLKVIQDYKHIKTYRDSFFQLSQSTFGIDFTTWYQLGFWDNRYIPISLVDEKQVISNVSMNKLDFIINGKKYAALQLGTVMTRPEYRNRGLSSCLIRRVLHEYNDSFDFIYLFANRNVLDFYPRFGFRSVDECQYTLDYCKYNKAETPIRKLNINDHKDLLLLSSFTKNRMPAGSEQFGTDQAYSIFMFYCLNVFYDDLYYIEDQDVIVIYKILKSHIDVFDIISQRRMNIKDVLNSIALKGMNRFVFHFTPDSKGVEMNKQLFKGSEVLFVQSKEHITFPFGVKHPITSQA